MTAIILHLSDIHIQSGSDQVLRHAQRIAACTYSSLPDASHLFIVVSGDIAYSGKPEQYECAKEFLEKVKEEIIAERAIPIDFIITPGNHDCDFDHDNAMRQIAINSLSDRSISIDKSVIDCCTVVQKPFFDFKEALGAGNEDKLWQTLTYDVEGKKVVFDTLNLSWVSRKKEVQGSLFFPHDRYEYKKDEAAHVRIIVMHHPMNWFSAGGYRDFRQFIRSLGSIIITGHEHQAAVGENFDTDSSLSIYIEGDVLQETGSQRILRSAFCLIALDLREDTYRVLRYTWSKDQYQMTEEGSWSDYRNLPPKHRSTFEIQRDFKRILNDPGANFLMPGRTRITLSDIFIYPDMLAVEKNKQSSAFMSSKELLDPTKTASGVILEAEDKVGSTSLIFRLYEEYYEAGYVPVYIRGDNIKSESKKHLEIVLKDAVTEQYGQQACSIFDQTPHTKKLLLVDDFDDCHPQSVRNTATILCLLRKRFGHIVISVGTLFEIRELLLETESQGIVDLSHYQIQPFGFYLRHKLIKKWVELSNDGTIDDGAMIDKIDQAEKAMDAVMIRNLIPSMPLYLLTLLQSIEAGRGGEFQDSALGHYYEYLLTEGFLASGVSGQKLKEFFDYCTELAWFFHSSNSRELTRDNLVQFNDFFSKKFHTVDFSVRLDRLVSAKVILVRGGEYYSFRYPYIYYFLKGRYLNRHINDINIRSYLAKCSKHLYVRENANTILFLVHHTNDEFVLNAILSALQDLFNQFKPVAFNGDTSKVAKIIFEAPRLKYIGTAPVEFRESYNKVRDDLDNGQDGLADEEEDGESLSLVAQYVTLFKTVEILGQILKNKYSSIERCRKIDILEELFSGPLRALSGFYDAISANPDHLVAEIELALLKDGDKQVDESARNSIARRIVATIIRYASIGFIYKAAISVSSNDLREDILEVVKRVNTPAVKLIALGVKLDSSSTLPKNDLISLKRDIDNDTIANSLMQMLLVRHLYMFRTSEKDKQWIESKLGIDLGFQRSEDIKSSKIKRLR